MIRPLEYCENIEHLVSSMETIDARILELVTLRAQYAAEKQRVLASKDVELVTLTAKEYQHEQ